MTYLKDINLFLRIFIRSVSTALLCFYTNCYFEIWIRPAAVESGGGWKWNVAAKPWPGVTELAVNCRSSDGPVERTS